jgi:hypothetical protein
MRRKAFTFVEIVVVLLLASLLVGLLYQALRVFMIGEKSTDRGAMRSMTLSRLTETIQMDIRSARKVDWSGPHLEITRWVFDGDRLVERKVTWTSRTGSAGRPGFRREEEGGRAVEYDLADVVRVGTTAVEVRVEKLERPNEIFGAAVPAGTEEQQ